MPSTGREPGYSASPLTPAFTRRRWAALLPPILALAFLRLAVCHLACCSCSYSGSCVECFLTWEGDSGGWGVGVGGARRPGNGRRKAHSVKRWSMWQAKPGHTLEMQASLLS